MARSNRNYIGSPAWDLRHRTSFNSSGYGVHGGQHSHSIDNGFLAGCDRSMLALNHGTVVVGGANGLGAIDWLGDVGFYANKPGMHGLYRAWDVTAVKLARALVDTNVNWRSSRPLADRRRYIGIAAALRMSSAYVLTGWYNSAHADHIHFDNAQGMPPLNSGWRSDAVIVQAACVLLNGDRMPVDGVWGPKTTNGFKALLSKMNMKCLAPRTNSSHARVVLQYIMYHGINNAAAGRWKWNC